MFAREKKIYQQGTRSLQCFTKGLGKRLAGQMKHKAELWGTPPKKKKNTPIRVSETPQGERAGGRTKVEKEESKKPKKEAPTKRGGQRPEKAGRETRGGTRI